MSRTPRWVVAADLAAVLAVVIVVCWALHPSLLLSRSLITGGDTGSHVGAAAYLRSQGVGTLTPWFPGWFDGMPLYTYYFVVPDVLAVIASYVIPFTVAFKLMTVLGSLLMPVTAYVMGRLLQAPRPIPASLAMATLPFLFDASFTIDGGNLFSTLAGEYAFSLSLALAMLTIGLFARGMRLGRGYWLAALSLSATLLCHVLPYLFTLVMIAVLMLFELAARRGWTVRGGQESSGDYARPVRFASGAGLLSLGVVAWWLLPFATLQSLTNSMGYVNDDVSSLHAVLRQLGWYTSAGSASGDRWVVLLALIGALVALWSRQRVGLVLTIWSGLSLGAFVLDPQSVIWNERLVPFWFLGTHLLAGWLVGYLAWRGLERGRVRRQGRVDEVFARDVLDDEEGEDVSAQRREATSWLDGQYWRSVCSTTVTVIVLGLASTLPGLVPPWASLLHLDTSGNQATDWAAFNYAGYQKQPAWPEYHDLMQTMARVGATYGCGQSTWEYNSNEQRFGTPMALMLLPYWTHNCIGSMEGLFFESSATTPYHFLDQAELSSAPSEPQVGLAYGPANVALGVRHLQLLGVRYFIAYSPAIVRQANADRSLQLVATTRRWPTPGVQWRIYLIHDAPLVVALTHTPVVASAATSRTAWLTLNEQWWLTPLDWSRYWAMTGPANWPRARGRRLPRPSPPLPRVRVSGLVQTTQSLSFTVSRTGVPMLVKISYFPRWHVSGATGPYRVSPNLMVVVPTSNHVSLHYGATPAQTVGDVVSEITLMIGVVVGGREWRRRYRARH